VVETERHLFLGKRIITLLSTVHIKLGAIVLVESHHFSLSLYHTFVIVLLQGRLIFAHIG
jgi:hypothetical protein